MNIRSDATSITTSNRKGTTATSSITSNQKDDPTEGEKHIQSLSALRRTKSTYLDLSRKSKPSQKITKHPWCELVNCHTRFSVENRMHLICVPGSQFHTYNRLMSVISQDIAQKRTKRFINFYYTHEGRHEGLYTNNDNYEDATPSSSSTGF
jgi:GTP cyclohydrolase II